MGRPSTISTGTLGEHQAADARAWGRSRRKRADSLRPLAQADDSSFFLLCLRSDLKALTGRTLAGSDLTWIDLWPAIPIEVCTTPDWTLGEVSWLLFFLIFDCLSDLLAPQATIRSAFDGETNVFCFAPDRTCFATDRICSRSDRSW
jgi:hypothetical protein